MKSILINYANDVFEESQKKNSISAQEIGGFDEVVSYSPKDIDDVFYNKNKNILNSKKGGGFWLWKPYFIKKTMESLSYGDILFYCDSGSYFIRSAKPLIDLCEKAITGIIVFELGESHKEKIWTKRDAFILMNCDSAKYSDTPQRLASFSVWEKTDYVMDFLEEYIGYAQDKRIITDINNKCGLLNYDGFK